MQKKFQPLTTFITKYSSALQCWDCRNLLWLIEIFCQDSNWSIYIGICFLIYQNCSCLFFSRLSPNWLTNCKVLDISAGTTELNDFRMNSNSINNLWNIAFFQNFPRVRLMKTYFWFSLPPSLPKSHEFLVWVVNLENVGRIRIEKVSTNSIAFYICSNRDPP